MKIVFFFVNYSNRCQSSKILKIKKNGKGKKIQLAVDKLTFSAPSKQTTRTVVCLFQDFGKGLVH